MLRDEEIRAAALEAAARTAQAAWQPSTYTDHYGCAEFVKKLAKEFESFIESGEFR